MMPLHAQPAWHPPADLQMPPHSHTQPSSNPSSKLLLPQFNFRKDIARNPELARAARAALSSSPGNHSVLTGGCGTARQPLQFGAELDSLTAVVDALDRDAAEESRINQQMAAAVLGRLQSGRAAAERTLAVLQVRRLLLVCEYTAWWVAHSCSACWGSPCSAQGVQLSLHAV